MQNIWAYCVCLIGFFATNVVDVRAQSSTNQIALDSTPPAAADVVIATTRLILGTQFLCFTPDGNYALTSRLAAEGCDIYINSINLDEPPKIIHTNALRFATAGALSPDGGKLFLVGMSGSTHGLYFVDLKTGSGALLTELERSNNLELQVESERYLFIIEHSALGFSGNMSSTFLSQAIAAKKVDLDTLTLENVTQFPRPISYFGGSEKWRLGIRAGAVERVEQMPQRLFPESLIIEASDQSYARVLMSRPKAAYLSRNCSVMVTVQKGDILDECSLHHLKSVSLGIRKYIVHENFIDKLDEAQYRALLAEQAKGIPLLGAVYGVRKNPLNGRSLGPDKKLFKGVVQIKRERDDIVALPYWDVSGASIESGDIISDITCGRYFSLPSAVWARLGDGDAKTEKVERLSLAVDSESEKPKLGADQMMPKQAPIEKRQNFAALNWGQLLQASAESSSSDASGVSFRSADGEISATLPAGIIQYKSKFAMLGEYPLRGNQTVADKITITCQKTAIFNQNPSLEEVVRSWMNDIRTAYPDAAIAEPIPCMLAGAKAYFYAALVTEGGHKVRKLITVTVVKKRIIGAYLHLNTESDPVEERWQDYRRLCHSLRIEI